jgi:hypothetical protein
MYHVLYSQATASNRCLGDTGQLHVDESTGDFTMLVPSYTKVRIFFYNRPEPLPSMTKKAFFSSPTMAADSIPSPSPCISLYGR